MGRIKSALVKRTGEQLASSMPESFSEDYEKNKKALGNTTMPSKRIRNMVAGYLSRLKRNSRSKQEA